MIFFQYFNKKKPVSFKIIKVKIQTLCLTHIKLVILVIFIVKNII